MSSADTSLSQAEAFARIRLLRSPNVGPVSYAQLLRRFGSGIEALDALPDLASRGGGRYSIAPVARIEAEVLAVRRAGARYLFHDSPDYPPLLRVAEGAPPILIARGDPALAARPTVAIVGARNSSAAAMKLARMFATELAAKGFVVVSGLARGIDGAAHKGALAGASEGGGTIGVIAGGIDVTYPPEHADLQEEIATTGLLLTEQPPGTEPLARHFPARNRIIAGLAIGTVVVEAAPRSGSLITARLAGEMGREVMAVPGSPLDARSQGCNQLIRDGATLVQSAEDVIEVLSDFHGAPQLRLRETFAATPELVDAAEDNLVDVGPIDIAALLTTAPVTVDDLIRLSGGSPGAVQMALLELELAGRLARHAGGRVSLDAGG
ncbi:DNA-processing protein DprA [Novosphingobium sp.]|uniref:DNA-processing protein DprA n=1 Tax=Novosphingobium sp. TaxID=1874826 RepID=UPI0025DAB3C3|nr:DNA-processing protein DprA [Novosphingobium sp.]